VKAIESEKTGKKKVEIKDDVMDKSPLYAALSAWRLQKAQDADVPAFTIAHNKTLKAIAQIKPVTLLALKEVPGMGTKSVKRFGDEILEIVLQFMDSATDSVAAQ
jgi:ATP-dependent DNA helicase RecQ